MDSYGLLLGVGAGKAAGPPRYLHRGQEQRLAQPCSRTLTPRAAPPPRLHHHQQPHTTPTLGWPPSCGASATTPAPGGQSTPLRHMLLIDNINDNLFMFA